MFAPSASAMALPAVRPILRMVSDTDLSLPIVGSCALFPHFRYQLVPSLPEVLQSNRLHIGDGMRRGAEAGSRKPEGRGPMAMCGRPGRIVFYKKGLC
jgi:hypothetical protein